MLRRIGLLIAIFCGGFAAAGQQRSPPPFHENREAASDLELTGLKGVPPGASRFVSREWIANLPRTSLKLTQSEDFPGISKTGVMLSGVSLDALAQNLGADATSSAIVAICADGYTATYSREYMRQHEPLFVLTVDGLSPHEWAVKNRQYDAEPYFISYKEFVPAFHVLSHKDQPLEPTGIVKLRFGLEERVYAEIQPKAASVQVRQGYRIARQNCFRCHNSGEYGGTKAAKSWSALGVIAKSRPQYFAAWVHNPQALDPKAEMPPNKLYDKATLTALQRYFATFAVEGQ